MFGSRLNLVSAALGFGMTAAFIAFIFARFICYRARRAPAQPSSPSDFPVDLDHAVRATPRSQVPNLAVHTIFFSR
jgi:hypothetical protein